METNKKAPAFTLNDENGNPVSLEQFRGQHVVLFFYPKANTPGWTIEARGFRDAYAKLKKAGLVVLGISPDTSKAQLKFKEKENLPYTLLADDKKDVAKLFDVLKEKNMYGKKVMGIVRSTFLIGPDGKLVHVFSPVKPEGHAEEVLSYVKAAAKKWGTEMGSKWASLDANLEIALQSFVCKQFSSRQRDLELLADRTYRACFDFAMSRDAGDLSIPGVEPDGVRSAFAVRYAALIRQVPLKID